MEVERKLKPLRIGKGLLCLLALFVMLLAPQVAWAEDYDLWVGGVQVTSDNYYNVEGDNISGSWGCVMFDVETKTLTLDKATVTGTTISGGSIVSKLDALTIVLKGTCALNSSDTCTAIRAEGAGAHSLTIKPGNPSCSLQFTCDRAIRDFSSVTLTGLAWDGSYTYENVTIGSHTGYMLTKVDNEETVEVGNAKLTYYGDGLFVAGVYVTSANASDVFGDGTVSFTPAQAAQGDNPATPATLTLDNANFRGSVVWPNSADLYVVFKGPSAVTMDGDNDYFFEKSGSGTPNLYFVNSGKTPIPLLVDNSFKGKLYDSEVWGSNSVKIDTNSNTEDEWWLNTETGISDEIALNWIGPDLIVAGVDVTTENASDVLGDGKVSFTPAQAAQGDNPATPATLTLNGASINGSIAWSSAEPLTIALKGESSINGGDDYCIKCTATEPTNSPALSFVKTSDATLVKLDMTFKSEKEIAISGFAEPGLENDVLTKFDNEGETTSVTTISSAVKLMFNINGEGDVNSVPETSDDGEGAYTYGYGQTVYLIVQQFDNYVFKSITAATSNNQNVALAEVDDEEVTMYSLTMPSDPVTVTANFAYDISNNDYTASIENAIYTGEALMPTKVTLTPEEGDPIVLTNGSDFTITQYQISGGAVLEEGESAKNAGTYIVTITGTGSYTGTKTASYTIEKATITDAQFIKPTVIENVVYNGTAQALVNAGSVPEGAKIEYLFAEITEDDFEELSDYRWNCIVEGYSYETTVPTATDAGYFAMVYRVNGGNNYNDIPASATETFALYPATVTEVTLSKNTSEYTGAAQTVTITRVMAGTIKLTANDYTVSYKKVEAQGTSSVDAPKEVGEYHVVVTGEGNFTGSKSANFTIVNKTLDVTFGGQTWASFYNTTEDFNLPDNVMAYIVTTVGQNSVTVSPINYVPKNVAVLLENNTTMTDVTNTSSAGNLLQGAGANGFAVTNDATVYALYNNKMTRVTSGTTIPAGKCYLVLGGVVNAGSAPQLNIVFDNEANTTGISEIERMRNVDNENVYDLQGRKVQKPSKEGIYIQNGRKVVINQKRK